VTHSCPVMFDHSAAYPPAPAPPAPPQLPCRDVSDKRKERKGDSGLTGPVDIPEVLLEKLGFPRKIQFQKVCMHQRGSQRHWL
jgi:hypothetical protein